MRDEAWNLLRATVVGLGVLFLVYHAASDLLHIRDSYLRGLIAAACAVVVVVITPVRR